MTTIKVVMSAYRDLSLTDRLAFYSTLTDQLADSSEEPQEFLLETRYNDGIRCPFCRTDHIVKNGRRRDGTQRYLCRECRKSFLAATDSVVSGTRKPLNVWKKYLHCMTEKKTLRESDAACGISMGTAFLWRHKILDALQRMDRSVVIGGTVEAETILLTAVLAETCRTRCREISRRPAVPPGNDPEREDAA